MAGKLRVGEPVRLLDGATATVVALHTLPGVGPMWDLSLADVHTFAVGDAQAVVHNCPVGGGDTSALGQQRVQYVVDHMSELAPDAVGGVPDLSEQPIKTVAGSYKPDIRTENALFEVGGAAKNSEPALNQLDRLSKAADVTGLDAYFAYDQTEGPLADNIASKAAEWNINVIRFFR